MQEDEAEPGRMKIYDDSPILSPETASTVSFSGEGNGSSSQGWQPDQEMPFISSHVKSRGWIGARSVCVQDSAMSSDLV